jgi:hypothetical protein
LLCSRTDRDRSAKEGGLNGLVLLGVERSRLTLEEVHGIAEELARKGLKGVKGDPLPNFASVRACAWIDANPLAFVLMIKNVR